LTERDRGAVGIKDGYNSLRNFGSAFCELRHWSCVLHQVGDLKMTTVTPPQLAKPSTMKQFLAVLIFASVATTVVAADFASCTHEATQRRDECLLETAKNGTSDERCHVSYENEWQECGYQYPQRRASVWRPLSFRSYVGASARSGQHPSS